MRKPSRVKDRNAIRRYSRLRHLFSHTRYRLQQGVALNIRGALFVVALLCLLLFGYGAIFCLVTIAAAIFTGQFLVGAILGFGLLACIGTVIGCIRVLKFISVKAPQGTLLNPLPPKENTILPETELLLRASVADSGAQSTELLRPASDGATEPAEQLLRPGSQ